MADGYAEPGEKPAHPRQIQQPNVHDPVAEQRGEEREHPDRRRHGKRRNGYAAAVQRRQQRGALPSLASTQSIRVEAYMPEFPADNTEVRIIAFMTEAANARPAF